MSAQRMLRVEGLCARVGTVEILNGIDLEVCPGEVHAVMGPNGSGKSTLAHVLMGRPGYQVTGGQVTLDGVNLLGLEPWERAQAGLFLALQQPTEVPGVSLAAVATEAARAAGRTIDTVPAVLAAEAQRIGVEPRFLDRSLNVDLSGGEKKRNEILQLSVLAPRYAVLDEIDSGLDIDALALVAARIKDATDQDGLGVLAITHFSRLLDVLKPDRVYVLSDGRIRVSGGPELVVRLEAEGYRDLVA